MKQFQAESKRLLDLMINSIYTNKEIFIRELISNASDALDKLYYKSLSDNSVNFSREDYFINIAIDKDQRLLTISDTGIGMNSDDMENNLGIIAHSGSNSFKKDNEAKDGVDIIGQFGVGFYSAFMVADKLTVISKPYGSDIAYKWESEGADGYTIEQCEKETTGTDIIITIKQDTEDDQFTNYLTDLHLKSLIKKHSDFIKYPIKMDIEKTRHFDDENGEKQHEHYFEQETLNSMVPIWRKNKSELTQDDYNEFYKAKHFGFEKPLKSIHASVSGMASYNTILYIPSRPAYDFYTKEFQKGLELYSNGVLIMDKCADLLPDHFAFVQGLVDSPDLSLNISRELLQQDKQLKFIAKKIKDKVKSELTSMLTNDRENYDQFFQHFGKQLKFGLYAEWGMHKDDLQDLVMFYSSTQKKTVSLAEYVERMPDDQKYIYYATGDSVERIEKLPQIEFLAEKGTEILYFTDDIDEFAVKVLTQYKEKEFKSVSSSDLDIGDAKEKDESLNDLFAYITEKLNGKVKEVRASNRLKRHPVCLIAQGDVSIEMEKILGSIPNNQDIQASKILEVNTDHAMFEAIKRAYEQDKTQLEAYANILYNQALLIEGLPIDDPVQFANDVCALMK